MSRGREKAAAPERERSFPALYGWAIQARNRKKPAERYALRAS